MRTTRPSTRGKWLFVGDQKFLVKGVTYGTFAPDSDGNQFPHANVVKSDFRAIAESGFNTVRTYTPPTKVMLDLAAEAGLRVLVGIPWEQHTTFLDRKETVREIIASVGDVVRNNACHPAILGYSVGNEIPSPIVRWHGRRAVERFIRQLYQQVKSADPDALVTYVNYPTTEYLELPFLDFHAFNVFLEEAEQLEGYLARLHNLVGDRPLLLTEVGLDSRRNGLERQAASIKWQTETVFTSGCAGVCVFSWTDEWWRGGSDIDDWDFGLVTRTREPKPALEAVATAIADAPVPAGVRRPTISVVVATRNGSKTINDTLSGLKRLNYPDYEIIVVDDGSTDETRTIAESHGVRVVPCAGAGLSDARNTGLRHASGEIVAYIDDDAYPDPDWLSYLAFTYETTDFVAVGGPNLIPEGSGYISQCVANAPGGPVHVLTSDRIAEHIPGCNMSFRREALQAIGGFDTRFTAAGDDVDACWRIQEMGWEIGFHPSALVWHYRRNSLRAYWKQQKGYGKAEALLERKWPERYNKAGHIAWTGHIYGRGITRSLFDRQVVYQGVWGTASFQSVYSSRGNYFGAFPLMPEWLLLIPLLGIVSLLGFLWSPLFLAFPILILTITIPILQAIRSSATAKFSPSVRPVWRIGLKGLVAVMHLVQPLGRLTGRIKHGLTIWRRRGVTGFGLPFAGGWEYWSRHWRTSTDWLESIENALRVLGAPTCRADAYSEWDMEVRGGVLGSSRMLLAIEEHGGGDQLIRVRFWPRISNFVVVASIMLASLTVWSLRANEVAVATATVALFAIVSGLAAYETMRSSGAVAAALSVVRHSADRADPAKPDSDSERRSTAGSQTEFTVEQAPGDGAQNHPVEDTLIERRSNTVSSGSETSSA